MSSPIAYSYWMVGYAAIFLNFVVFTAAFILFQLTSETVCRWWRAPSVCHIRVPGAADQQAHELRRAWPMPSILSMLLLSLPWQIGEMSAVVTGTSTYAVLVSCQKPVEWLSQRIPLPLQPSPDLRHKKSSASPPPLTCLPPPMLPSAGHPAGQPQALRPPPPCNEASHAPMLPAVQILTFVLLFLLSFSGFLVSDVPVYFR